MSRLAAWVGRHIRKDVILLFPIEQVGWRNDGLCPALDGIGLPELDQALWIVVRERLEQHGVHHAEHRSGRADAQRQGQNRDGGEAGGLPQGAKCVTKILPHNSARCFRLAECLSFRSKMTVHAAAATARLRQNRASSICPTVDAPIPELRASSAV